MNIFVFSNLVPRVATLSLLVSGLLLAGPAAVAQTPAKNIVLVHGAFADGSGWEGVFNILTSRGYTVTIVQNPLTSLDDDVAAVNRALARQNGPTVLVGHSWGGSVITQAGMSAKVVSLVYVNAYQPDAGETTLQWAMSAPPAPENGVMPPDDAGFIYYNQAKFHAGFCADVSKEKAAFMYASQGPVAARCFGVPLTQAAWKTKPAWAVLSRDDKSINPDIQRKMYQRSGTTVTEIRGSHAVFIAQPKAVADVIEAAAKGAGRKQ